jgi:hypothetical protein
MRRNLQRTTGIVVSQVVVAAKPDDTFLTQLADKYKFLIV